MIRDVPIRGRRRLGQATIVSADIVSAVDADTGEALDPGSFGMYYGDGGTGSSPDGGTGATSATASAPALFTSPNAYASGTGLGPINLPSPFPSPSLGTSWIIWALIIGAGILLLSNVGGRR